MTLRIVRGFVLTSCLVVPAAAAQSAPALRIENPDDGSIISSRTPWIRVCVSGGDEKTRSTFTARLDGESITRGFDWSGDCAEWSPRDGWVGFGKRHAWSEPPYEMAGWTPGMRDGGHHFDASVTGPDGNTVTAESRFRIETEHMGASLGVGVSDLSLDGFAGPFAPVNLLEGRFGPQRVSTLARDAGVATYSDMTVSIGGASTHLASGGDPGETETSLWRFMAGKREGYAYRTGDVAFIAPYQGNSVFFVDSDAYTGPFGAADQLAFEPFDGHTLVGAAFEGGVAFGINRSITLDAGYEQMAVYPHWVFWEAAGSGLVHGISLAVAEGVSRQVARSSPRAAPIVSFLLRNGISYAIFHQRRSEVNWPFGGGPGLTYETVKVSFTFTY